ncbi:MAG: hypothetical protein GEU93_18695 [Propionibacteriales bacterium]|nr:hypothetical protein [Propionibacteriales bacterium]
MEFASSRCQFEDGWRRVLGWGAQIIVIPILDVTPDTRTTSTVGCSFASTHNYVVVEPAAGAAVAAHEIGHACLLPHDDDSLVETLRVLLGANHPWNLTSTSAPIRRAPFHRTQDAAKRYAPLAC